RARSHAGATLRPSPRDRGPGHGRPRAPRGRGAAGPAPRALRRGRAALRGRAGRARAVAPAPPGRPGPGPGPPPPPAAPPPVHNPDPIAEGVRTPSLGQLTFPLVLANVDDMVTVSEEAIVAATLLLWNRMKVVVEPTGALPLAALLEGAVAARGLRVGAVLS